MEKKMPAAGWYSAPDGSAMLRWWDGEAWQAATAPLPTKMPPEPEPPAYGPPPTEAAQTPDEAFAREPQPARRAHRAGPPT